MLGLVRLVLYVYGQPKLNISVSEILNRNQLKWLELNRFRSISVSINFGRFLVYQREGYWDFWNLNFNHILKQRNRATKRERERERVFEQRWATKKEKRTIIPWEKKENDHVMGRLVCERDCGGWCVRASIVEEKRKAWPWNLEKKRKEWGGWTEKCRG